MSVLVRQACDFCGSQAFAVFYDPDAMGMSVDCADCMTHLGDLR